MAEKQRLGILVSSNKHVEHLIGVVRAAKKAGKALCIFFTHEGVLMTQDPKYQEIAEILSPEEMDEISVCNAVWEAHGLKDQPVPPGMTTDDLATQSRHVAMIEKCDRYMVI